MHRVFQGFMKKKKKRSIIKKKKEEEREKREEKRGERGGPYGHSIKVGKNT